MQAGGDTPLIEASCCGDTAAFAKIIERHQRTVYAVAFSGVRDRALADDVTQETFVIAWRQLGELRDPSRLAPWLCGIARNVARDLRKRRQRETLGEVSELVVDGRTPYEAMHEAEAERIVATALGEVPDVYREPLVLFYYEERSVDEVARCLGISAATTNKRLSRGRKCLAERVAVVEHHVARRGPRPGLAASVLAMIGVAASASHVDASPAGKGSTMNKFAIAAVVAGALGGAGVLALTATRGDAHAGTSAAKSPSPATTPHVHSAATKQAGHESCAHGGHAMPSFASVLSALGGGGAGSAPASGDSSAAPDCSEVGTHLAELEADATHGPSDRPDDATCEQCASHYTNQCESAEWTPERRACTLAAGDLMNAHLCAGGGVAPSTTQPTDVPAELACGVVAKDIASTVQAAGLWSDIKDMPQQLEAACDLANWPVDLRRCFASADSVAALQACVTPGEQPSSAK